MHSEIKNLINKYFEGQTTLQEEKKIRTYFQISEVEDSLKPFQPLFQYFEEEKGNTLNESFEHKVLQKLPKNGTIVPLRPRRFFLLRIAAAVVILFVAGIAFLNQPVVEEESIAIDWSKYEVKNPEEALKHTKSALFFVSSKMNAGMNTATKEVSKVQKASRFFK